MKSFFKLTSVRVMLNSDFVMLNRDFVMLNRDFKVLKFITVSLDIFYYILKSPISFVQTRLLNKTRNSTK
jgi:hypothetical protein